MAPRAFGPFVFDSATGSLTKHGAAVKLQPQPARVLSLLVGRAGQLVTRDELKQTVWSEGTHVDFERGLNFCISQIRFALGDSADTPRYIETEPKRGYRFIGALPQIATAGPAPEPPRTRWSPRALVIVAVLLIAAALVSAIAALSHDGRVRLAVFPFDNETADSAYEGIAGSIADETVSRLSTPERIAEFDTIGNAAILRRPRTFRDVRAVGRDLAVQYVVLAQLKRDENGVRLIAHLIRVTDQAHVWAQTFDRPSFDLATQSEIAEAIAAAVAAKL